MFYSTLYYLAMILQLGNPSYTTRNNAYLYLVNNPHQLIEFGVYNPHTEIRHRCTDLLHIHYEKVVKDLGYMPLIDSAWYDEKELKYAALKYNGFLDKYNTIYLKNILDNMPFNYSDSNFNRYRDATRIWIKELVYQKTPKKELIEILETLRKRDLCYLKQINHETYKAYLYVSLKSAGL
jgi:hypothetical protein